MQSDIVNDNLFVTEEIPVENFAPFASVVTLLIPLSPATPNVRGYLKLLIYDCDIVLTYVESQLEGKRNETVEYATL